MRKILFMIMTLIVPLVPVAAQSPLSHPLDTGGNSSAVISYKGRKNYSFTERSDLRVYQNGRYVGLQSKLVSAFIIPFATERGLVYEGDFFVHQDTSRNSRALAGGTHGAIASSFMIGDDGKLTMIVDNGYPSFRSFPAYSSHTLKKGDVWQAQATRAVDPLSKGVVTKMPIYVQYTYKGEDVFNGESVHLIDAEWATRYGMNSITHFIDFGGDKELEKAQGSHKATIIVSKRTGAALVIRDNVDETFWYADGNSYQFKGTITLFTEYPPAVDRSKLIDAIKRIVKLDDAEAAALANPTSEFSDKNHAGSASEKNVNSVADSRGIGADDGTGGSGKSKSADGLPDRSGNRTASAKDGGTSEGGGNPADEGGAEKAKKLGAESGGKAVAGKSERGDGTSGDDIGGSSSGFSFAEHSPDAKTGAEKSGGKGKIASVADNIGRDERGGKTSAGKTMQENPGSAKDGARSISVDNTDAGIRLTIQNLRFKADSDELLPEERGRLEQIAQILMSADGAKFLIEGHTASTGNPKGEMNLSVQRARSIAQSLERLGIDGGRFICKGSGGTKPVAPNTTEEGKAKNRRVEITILE